MSVRVLDPPLKHRATVNSSFVVSVTFKYVYFSFSAIFQRYLDE